MRREEQRSAAGHRVRAHKALAHRAECGALLLAQFGESRI